jgi:hydrogenase/urease accessory protein HupE
VTSRRSPVWFVAGVLLAALPALQAGHAHEIRPAYLALKETDPGQFSVVWRTPVLAGMRLPVDLKLPHGVRKLRESTVQELTDSLVERRWIDAGTNPLSGQRIEFPGLQFTITDVLVRIEMLDGTRSTTLVRPSRPWMEIAAARGPLAVAGAYLMHGTEHILFGFDHLLFVLALLLIVRSPRVLLWTITAFTVAHSITLSLATLGVVQVPGPPVEATIALSIMLLACEIIRVQRGQASLTAQWPWLVAFTFGLLHGFGFAGALTEIGLPQGDIPLALFSFNLGVEAGQLIFIAAILAFMTCCRRLDLSPPVEWRALTAGSYAIGITAAFWFIERMAGFAT